MCTHNMLAIWKVVIAYGYRLVGALEHVFHVLEVIIATDELMFFRGVAQPPTANHGVSIV